jgi:hypothetical protein
MKQTQFSVKIKPLEVFRNKNCRQNIGIKETEKRREKREYTARKKR